MNLQRGSEETDNAQSRAFAPEGGSSENRGMALIDSDVLFGKNREVAIMHNGAVYRLKITRFGKLILNK